MTERDADLRRVIRQRARRADGAGIIIALIVCAALLAVVVNALLVLL